MRAWAEWRARDSSCATPRAHPSPFQLSLLSPRPPPARAGVAWLSHQPASMLRSHGSATAVSRRSQPGTEMFMKAAQVVAAKTDRADRQEKGRFQERGSGRVNEVTGLFR